LSTVYLYNMQLFANNV